MKIIIPQNCCITDEALNKLKKHVKALIENYDNKYKKEYKIYLYSNFLKINYQNHNYNVAIVEYNHELFWYLKPFYGSYLLIKDTEKECLDLVLSIIKIINL